jgi:hypothetical protein
MTLTFISLWRKQVKFTGLESFPSSAAATANYFPASEYIGVLMRVSQWPNLVILSFYNRCILFMPFLLASVLYYVIVLIYLKCFSYKGIGGAEISFKITSLLFCSPFTCLSLVFPLIVQILDLPLLFGRSRILQFFIYFPFWLFPF